MIDGSALLTLQKLRILKVDGWRIYLPSGAASSGNGAAELALTELHEMAWWHVKPEATLPHGNHEVLLHAALRGGDRADLISCDTLYILGESDFSKPA